MRRISPPSPTRRFRVAPFALWPALLSLCLLGACSGPKRTPPVSTPPLPVEDSPVPGAPFLLGVGILEGQKSLELACQGEALLLDGESGKRLARIDSQNLYCHRQDGQVVWRSGTLGGQAATIILQPVDPGHRVLADQKEYRGEFLVLPSPGAGGLTLVNQVDLENYLRGVVPWEIGRHGRERLAALEAQAVAARTYTVSHLGARRELGFDVFASVMDQVYKGAKDEDPLCNEAVDTTAGLVLRSGGSEIDAYYSACCGGVSSNIQEVWPKAAEPYLKSLPDTPESGGKAFCAKSRYFRWTESWTWSGLETILQKTLPEYLEHMSQGSRAAWAGPLFSPRDGGSDGDRPGSLRGLEILSRTTSGRVRDLAVTTDAGTYHVRGDRVRWALPPRSGNPFILRSAMFDLEIVEDETGEVEVRANGKGFGHGIGLCQTGALGMASAGYDFKAILAHYYAGAVLARFDPQDADR